MYKSLTYLPSPLYISPLPDLFVAKDLLTQWNEAVWGAQRPLFVVPAHVDTDLFAAACALGHALHNAGKDVTILCPRTMSTHAQFLISHLRVEKTLQETITYQCAIPANVHIKQIHHDIFKDGGGIITLQFADGQQKDIAALSFSSSLPAFDRIITFGAQDLGDIASLFGENHALLLETPLVTFSALPSDEAFGRWNVVYEQAVTLSEVVAYFLHDTAPESLKDHVATCALAGIIAKTKHFRSEPVTPSMLTISADLVASGADRLKIIEELYRTRSIDSLRLWGAACARLQEIAPGILFSELTDDDFLRTHTSSEALPDIAQEILQSSDVIKEIIFFSREKNLLHASVFVKKPLDARAFLGALRTEGTREVAYHTFAQGTNVQDVLGNISATQKRSS